MSEPQQEKQNQGQDSIIEPSSSNQAEKNKQSLPSNVKKKKNHNNNYHSWSNKSKQNNRTSSWKKSSSFGQNKYGLPSFGSSTWQSTTGTYLDDIHDNPKSRGPPKTRWLRGIAAHLQQAIVRATLDGARGENEQGNFHCLILQQ
ncbi:unnamed protein product [Rotaria socialis]|uniref:Uncharacterized protein n=1 Tax=Rotaria socialis TaxID=392032 RepID=A0A817WQZ6_9BILA|nr:unnamed protein product [Rotaria socialis]CAF3470820.1 unnamed protein product [Rotaria socialis]CAF3494490.1 unnamed protein product [Rotaria socialis]CAF3608591.1 unnamed protein product [Rotaria socialis]